MIEFQVKDMTCNHCVSMITKAVKEVDAKGVCEVDLDGKRVRITSERPSDEFRDAIVEAGYTPETVTPGSGL